MKKKKRRAKKTTKKNIDNIDLLMIGVIVLLGLLVVFLGIKLIVLWSNSKNDLKANIVIPVIEKKSSSTFVLTMSEFNKDSAYVFKVNNYRKKKVNDEELTYTINIRNEDKTDLVINKYGSDTNLAKDEAVFSIENNKLKAKKKQSDIYVVKINSKKNIKKDTKVRINIES